MRRSPIVLTATIAGTAAVLAFHPHAPSVATATATSATATSSAITSAAGSGTSASNGSGSSGSGSGSRSGGVSGTATGEAVDTQYGAAEVRVTVKRGKITSVEAVQLQSGDPHSAQISSSAAPILQQEVLSRQTAAVDAVSGATFTSASYLQSVQSALDKLGFEAADGSHNTLQVPSGGHF